MARRVADFAVDLGIFVDAPRELRRSGGHIGAILADTVLQAGLNYRNVVLPRVTRIVLHYPEAAELSGVMQIIARGSVGDLLQWSHDTKIGRFGRLAAYIFERDVNSAQDLYSWLAEIERQPELLQISGIGPKTVDYLYCLMGFDRIPVDRHIRQFVARAGVAADDYERVRTVASFAADLLGLTRRDFDAWIWRLMSTAGPTPRQLSLF
jgi:hypothetical protein